MLEWFIFALIGAVAGLLSGLLGLGGGVVIVPALLFVFSIQSQYSELLIHSAIATSLMTIIVTSLSSIYAHHARKNINWSVVIHLVPGLMLGGFLGAYMALSLSGYFLQTLFALYLFIVAALTWKPVLTSGNSRLLKNRAILAFVSLFTGLISALVGIGGGTFIVPYLVMAKQSMTRAVAISATCSFPIALSAVLGFIVLSPSSENSAIHWTAFWGMVSTSVLFSFIGARLASHLSVSVMKKIFSLILILMSVYLIKW